MAFDMEKDRHDIGQHGEALNYHPAPHHRSGPLRHSHCYCGRLMLLQVVDARTCERCVVVRLTNRLLRC